MELKPLNYDEFWMKIFKLFNTQKDMNYDEAYGIARDIVEVGKEKKWLTEQEYYQLYEYTEWIYHRKVAGTVWGNDSTLKPEWIPKY